MSHLARPPPLKPLSVNGLTIFRLPEPPLSCISVKETTDLSVTQQEDTTLPVSLHDSESLVTEPSAWQNYNLLYQLG